MTDKKTSQDFWLTMQKIAREASADPDWSKAGINLNPRNFETYRREIDSGDPVAQASASDKAAK